VLEELFAALLIGLSFSNAFVCIFLAFGISTVERRKTGAYFIAGRFIGVITLGLIIASIGFIFDSYKIYFLILFGILTIVFGGFVVLKMYLRIKNQKSNNTCTSCNNSNSCNSSCNENSNCPLLGVFRGATPCLKIFILAPLLIIVDLWLAFLMILIYALASTIYPVIGFLSASLLGNLRRYEAHVQITGAIVLISIGVFTIYKQLMIQSCTVGI
jgi:cytochrome c biogenesis protein CcdA